MHPRAEKPSLSLSKGKRFRALTPNAFDTVRVTLDRVRISTNDEGNDEDVTSEREEEEVEEVTSPSDEDDGAPSDDDGAPATISKSAADIQALVNTVVNARRGGTRRTTTPKPKKQATEAAKAKTDAWKLTKAYEPSPPKEGKHAITQGHHAMVTEGSLHR